MKRQAASFRLVPRLLAAALGLALLSSEAAHAALDWPELPLPPKADMQWIARSMRVSGIPTRVLQFQSRASRGEVVEYYRAYWTGAYAQPPSVRAVGDSTVVGQKHGPYLLTVTVRDAEHGGSDGLIAEALVAGSKTDLDPGRLPLLPGAHVVRVIESDDPGQHSREVLVVSPQMTGSVLQFYQASLQGDGWQQLQANEAPRTASSAGGGFLVFARGAEQMQLSVAPGKGRGTWLLANLVTKDTGSGSP
jgi:hypothetical protein